MTENSHAQEIPSHAQLFKALAVSILIAGLLLITAVLPAEYGVDPTGIGHLLGLTGISEASVEAPVDEAKPTKAVEALPRTTLVYVEPTHRDDVTTLTLAPGKGAEVKATMTEGQVMAFEWSIDRGVVNLDMHGEPPNAGDKFTSHRRGKLERGRRGLFTAPFTGTHGWWWSNQSEAPLTVTLKTSGFYEAIGPR